ncbi:MAG: tetratricopeptide repeat protein [Treponema sp.]|nr:tetratricopeptide repeat protein [Treponema sp.]
MTCTRPYTFFALLLLIPALLIIIFKTRKCSDYSEKQMKFNKSIPELKRIFNFKQLIYIRTFFLSLSWIMLTCAAAGLYWGTYQVPVQKNGTTVSLVFDISNSMNATDCPGKLSRLKASAVFAQKLIDKIQETPSNSSSISVVLAKGDGNAAIPATQDYAIIESLLSALSSSLMTVPGSSLGKGILKAKETFPQNFSSAGRIWLFTDGEETDGHLKNALVECIKSGIPVSIIGFGMETESSVLAGDGKTTVQTALRTEKILSMIDEIQKSSDFYMNQTPVIFVNSNEKGSAIKLLSQLKTSDGQFVSYEAKPVPRYKFFLFFALVFFALNYFVVEIDYSKFKINLKKSIAVSSLFAIFLFSGCNSNTLKILKGSYAFSQKQYGHSVSCFLDTLENAKITNNLIVADYSLFNLGTSYLMLEENEAALIKYSEISSDAPDVVKFTTFYNCGVICHKNGQFDEAADYFKKALSIDNSNINAKINLELSIQMTNVDAKQNEAEAIPASTNESSVQDMENEIFETIKENDKNQWKNSETQQPQNLANDY